MDSDKLHDVSSLGSIKGISYPSNVGFRQLIVTGPPGCGKSSRIEHLGGWPGEAFLDLTRAGWWRDRILATRPREVHLGLPFAGNKEGLALFEEAQEGVSGLIFEPQRLRLPPLRRKTLLGDSRHRFVLEFLLPPAAKVLAVREERAVEGTHPVDEAIYLEQIEHQLQLYFRVAEILHEAGFGVLVRRDFEATPQVFSDTPRSRASRPRKTAPGGWSRSLLGRLLSKRPESAIRQLDRIRLAGESQLLDAALLPLGIRQGKARLRLYRDRLIWPGKRELDSLVLLDTSSLDAGVSGFASLAPGEVVRMTQSDRVVKDSLPLADGVNLRLEIENARDGVVVTDLHSERGTEIVALGDGEAENLLHLRHQENVERLLEIFGRPLTLRSPRAAHGTLQAVNEQLQKAAWRPLDDRGRPGSLVELPPGVCPVIVGDLHANVDNLLKILCVNSFLEEIEAKRAVLIVLGDAVHPEDEANLGEMESSLLMMDLILRLMETFPDHVVYLRGNHDSFSSDVTKAGVPQGRLWRKCVKKTRGAEFLADMKRFYASSPLIAASDDFVACHAGPPQVKASRNRLINAATESRLLHELTWNRFKGPGNPGGYAKADVKGLKSSLGISTKATMVVSHNPVRDGHAVWLNAGGIKRHHVVYSAGSEDVAVFARLGDRLRPLIYRCEPMLGALSLDDSPALES